MRPSGLSLLAVLVAAGCGPRSYQGLEPALGRPAPPSEARADARGWFLRARVAEAHDDLEEADRSWSWALRMHRSSSYLHVGWSQYLERQGRRDEAIDAAAHAADLAPDEPRPLEVLGVLLVRADREVEAQEVLTRAVEAGAGGDAHGHLLQLHRKRGELEVADRVLDGWLAREVRGPEALDRAHASLDRGRYGEAVDDLVLALDQGVAPLATTELLAESALLSCRVGTAWEWARRSGAHSSSDPSHRRAVGRIALAAGDPDLLEATTDPGEHLLERVRLLARWGRARQALDLLRAERTAPPSPLERLEEGALLRQLGLLEPALVALERVPAEDHHGPRALVLQVEVLGEQGRHAEAVRRARAATGDAPQLGWALSLALQGAGEISEAEAGLSGRSLAALRLERGDLEGAVVALEDEADVRAPAERARVLERLGRPQEAGEAWLEAVGRDASDPALWLGVARTLPDKAPGAVHEALRADPCNVPALVESARRSSGSDELALLERAVDAEPLDPRALDALAAAYQERGMLSLSRNLLLRAIRRAPTPERRARLDGLR